MRYAQNNLAASLFIIRDLPPNSLVTRAYLIIPQQQPAPLQKILCKWEMREVIGNICKTFPYIFIVYYFFLLPLVKS